MIVREGSNFNFFVSKSLALTPTRGEILKLMHLICLCKRCFAANCVPLLIQQNADGLNFFNRSWAEFKAGFSDKRGNYWLGNERLHQLTQNGRYKLRFDLQARDNFTWYWTEYSSFNISSEATNYTLWVSGYSGNLGDGFSSHNGLIFTTYDRDNDRWNGNCAVSNGAGFWYRGCSSVRVNNSRSRNKIRMQWLSSQTGTLYLHSARMWLTC